MDEDSLEDRLETASDEMMYDSITEVTRQYLSLHRISHDKCSARLEAICPTLYLFPEFYTFRLIVQLELESTIRISLVTTAIIVGSEDVSEGKHDARDIYFRRNEQRRRAIESESVVVRVTIIAMDSPRIEALVILSQRHPVRPLALIHDLGVIRVEDARVG